MIWRRDQTARIGFDSERALRSAVASRRNRLTPLVLRYIRPARRSGVRPGSGILSRPEHRRRPSPSVTEASQRAPDKSNSSPLPPPPCCLSASPSPTTSKYVHYAFSPRRTERLFSPGCQNSRRPNAENAALLASACLQLQLQCLRAQRWSCFGLNWPPGAL